jgi:hypothetical protein
MHCTLCISALLLSLGFTTSASGELYRFNNTAPGQPDYFDWTETQWLDVTSSRHSQAGVDNGVSSFGQLLVLNSGLIQGVSGAAELEIDELLVAPTQPGWLIPSGSEFSETGYSFLGGSLLPEGKEVYFGIRIMVSDWHYGWIGVVREGNELAATAWAYETEPNVPAQSGQLIPEPGTLVVLSLSAAIIVLKKRRSGNRCFGRSHSNIKSEIPMFPRNASRTIGTSNRRVGLVAQVLIICVTCLVWSSVVNAAIGYLNPDGPERFNWAGDGSVQSWLDITRPWDEQSGMQTGRSSISQETFQSIGLLSGNPSGIEIHVNAVEGLPLVAPVEYVPFPQSTPEQFLWTDTGFSFAGSLGSLIPEGEQAVIGLRFELNNAYHYGWIGVVRTGTSLDAFTWGYEQWPGVIPFEPIVPEPSTLSFVTIVAVVVFKRRTGLR